MRVTIRDNNQVNIGRPSVCTPEIQYATRLEPIENTLCDESFLLPDCGVGDLYVDSLGDVDPLAHIVQHADLIVNFLGIAIPGSCTLITRLIDSHAD